MNNSKETYPKITPQILVHNVKTSKKTLTQIKSYTHVDIIRLTKNKRTGVTIQIKPKTNINTKPGNYPKSVNTGPTIKPRRTH